MATVLLPAAAVARSADAGDALPWESQVTIDGKIVDHPEGKERSQTFDAAKLAKMAGGNGHHVQVLATNLDRDAVHMLELEPLLTGPDQELRLESICIAGVDPGIVQ